MNKTHDCPLCSTKVTHFERHPKQVCDNCKNRACDAYGRRLKFQNKNLSGGFQAFYLDNGAEYKHQICYIDGKRCFAAEHRFGGIVIEIVQ